MTRQNVRMFSAEKIKHAQRNQDTTLADVMNAIQSLENSIGEKISGQINSLSEKLDVSIEDEKTTPLEDIMAEIHAMNDHIATTKQEIAALKPADEANTTISAATEELSEVVKATEEAANVILENAEQIDVIVAQLREKIPEDDPDVIGPDVDKLEFISVELLTACSFQDITGQRINKVVNSLNYIEERLQKMIEIWRIEHGTADLQEIARPKGDERGDKELLHGPQSEGTAMNQDDIDAMFD
ncbi:MAG: protein phosphatase CheZ [Alphaproteobacteria bacterium]|nr:protein phosphatase CheZ [Alphaproteobacteria bacterium]